MASVILAADGCSSCPKQEQLTIMPLASAQPRTVTKTRHNPKMRPAPMRFVRGARISAPQAISSSGRRIESGPSHVCGIKVKGVSAIANCALAEALTRPEYRKTPANPRRIKNAVCFTFRVTDECIRSHATPFRRCGREKSRPRAVFRPQCMQQSPDPDQEDPVSQVRAQ